MTDLKFIAEDVKLRQSINSATFLEGSKFLDSLGTAQIVKQIDDTVMKTTKDATSTLAEQSGEESFLIDVEMKA
jgi:hypothetical protein